MSRLFLPRRLNALSVSAVACFVALAAPAHGLTLVASPNPTTLPGLTTLTATWGFNAYNSGHAIRIYQDQDTTPIASCGSGFSCVVTVPSRTLKENNNLAPKSFTARVEKTAEVSWTHTGEDTEVVEYEPYAFDVSLSASSESPTLPETLTFTSTVNLHLYNTGIELALIDADTGTVLKTCGNSDSCTYAWGSSVAANLQPPTRRVYVQLRVTSDPSEVLAQTPVKAIQYQPYEFEIDFSATPQQPIVPAALTSTAAVNYPLSNAPVQLVIVNADNDQALKTCSNNSACSHTWWTAWSDNANPPTRRVKAEVRLLNGDTIAETQTEEISYRRQLFNVGLQFTNRNDWGTHVTYTANLSSTPGLPGGYVMRLRRSSNDTSYGTCSQSSCTMQWMHATGEAYYATVEDGNGRVYGRSPTFQLSPDEPVNRTVDGIDIASVATMFSSVEAICTALTILPLRTNTNPSSLNDQQVACLAVQNGPNPTKLKALAAVLGIAGGASAVHYLLKEAEKPSPAAGQETVDDGTAPYPVPPLILPLVDQVADTLVGKNPKKITQTTADKVANQCLYQARQAASVSPRERCENDPIFVSGSNVPEATNHDRAALGAKPFWYRQNREHSGAKVAWSTRMSDIGHQDCAEKTATQHCDEFPAFGTEQGGTTAPIEPSVLPISATQNMSQGGSYSAFISTCGLNTGLPPAVPGTNSTGGTPFLWIALDPALGVPTLSDICNDGNS